MELEGVIGDEEEDVGAVCERRLKNQESRGKSKDSAFHGGDGCWVLGLIPAALDRINRIFRMVDTSVFYREICKRSEV